MIVRRGQGYGGEGERRATPGAWWHDARSGAGSISSNKSCSDRPSCHTGKPWHDGWRNGPRNDPVEITLPAHFFIR
jgi:hypothetical protein